jgi:hypothetical protein
VLFGSDESEAMVEVIIKVTAKLTRLVRLVNSQGSNFAVSHDMRKMLYYT